VGSAACTSPYHDHRHHHHPRPVFVLALRPSCNPAAVTASICPVYNASWASVCSIYPHHPPTSTIVLLVLQTMLLHHPHRHWYAAPPCAHRHHNITIMCLHHLWECLSGCVRVVACIAPLPATLLLVVVLLLCLAGGHGLLALEWTRCSCAGHPYL